jgi:hypothetical protein
MFAKLNISINEVRKFINALDWSDIRQRDIDEYFNSEKRTSKKVIDDSLLKNNIWDGDGVREMNFPAQIGTRQIFISHSRDDIEDVKKFAYALETEFGVSCFVDSMVWENMNNLIKAFDGIYSLAPDKKTTLYGKRNYSTSHVHTMLATALLEMINNCECFLFIASKNSTLNLNYFRDHSDATLSPWIYEENTFVKYIMPIIPEWLLRKRERRYFSGGIGRINEDRKLNIAYKLDMSTFHPISAELLLDLHEERLLENDFLYGLYDSSGALQQLELLL